MILQIGDEVRLSYEGMTKHDSEVTGIVGEPIGDGWFNVDWSDGHKGVTSLDNPFLIKLVSNDSGI